MGAPTQASMPMRHGGRVEIRPDLAARPLLTQHAHTTLIVAYDVE